MKRVFLICLQVSSFAVVGCALIHLASLFTYIVVLKWANLGMFLGVFLLAPFSLWASQVLRRQLGVSWIRFRMQSLTSMMARCPKIMRTITLSLFLYYVFSFAAFFILDSRIPDLMTSETMKWRVFCWVASAAEMAVYGFLIALFYSVLYTHDKTRECPNGHPVFPWSKRCGECGQPLASAMGRPL